MGGDNRTLPSSQSSVVPIVRLCASVPTQSVSILRDASSPSASSAKGAGGPPGIPVWHYSPTLRGGVFDVRVRVDGGLNLSAVCRSCDRTQVQGSFKVVLCVYDGVTVRRTWAVVCGEYSMRVRVLGPGIAQPATDKVLFRFSPQPQLTIILLPPVGFLSPPCGS